MPLEDRVGLDDSQGRTPVGPEAGEDDPEEAVTEAKPGTFTGVFEDGDLLWIMLMGRFPGRE
jgi:hypothetical protein